MKERLVGAAVLVAIAVWLIPWVLDGPESALDTGIASLQLPVAEEPMPMRTQTLRLGDPEAALETTVPTLAAPPEQPVAAAVAPSVVAEGEANEPDAVAQLPAASPQPAPIAAAPAPKPAPATAAKGDWLVQLGSFGEEANARRLAQRAGTFGYKAEVASYRSNGRTLYRVRVGPAVARAQADATASALRAHGVEARVVAAD